MVGYIITQTNVTVINDIKDIQSYIVTRLLLVDDLSTGDDTSSHVRN